jgi:SulP family sulfate permease
MALCIVARLLVAQIPMAALVAIMVLVAFATFDWHSIAPPLSSACPPARSPSWP